MAGLTTPPLDATLRAELTAGVPAAVAEFAAQLAARAGAAAAAVLYYGSNLRSGALDGVLDFYVLVDRVGAWPGSGFTRLANRVLPPNVGYAELDHAGEHLRAKYAVLSVAQFRQRLGTTTLDTTLWARFCQPSACAWSRSAQDLDDVVAAVATGVRTAAHWAAAVGPPAATPADYWRALFAATYATELRVERAERAVDIVGRHPERYAMLLPAAWQQLGVPFDALADGSLAPALDRRERQRLARRWRRRQRFGRPLNVLRLLKATFTFEGGLDYVAWKIERHRGLRLTFTPWQRRHPLLAAPALYLQLRRRGIL